MTVWYVDKNRVKVTLSSVFTLTGGVRVASTEVHRIEDTPSLRTKLFCANGGSITVAAYTAALAEDSGTPLPSENIIPSGAPRRTRLVSAASINATVLKTGPGQLLAVHAFNVNAALRYLKFFNKATAPAPATDAALILMTIPLEPSRTVDLDLTRMPLAFTTGLGFVTTVGIADTDVAAVAASEIIVNAAYS